MAFVSVDPSCWPDVPGQKGAAGFLTGDGKASSAVNAVSVNSVVTLSAEGKVQVANADAHAKSFMGKGLKTMPLLVAGATRSDRILLDLLAKPSFADEFSDTLVAATVRNSD